ncbi:hypothetical protein D7B24_006225 [Verticillium nonalfalfae]|uniref:Cns1/TTC4 wheel domain-containing protein n=1 Tax=Verticillium nonalfalfae TaxID=1051616 RepID=A0A3M9YCN3_9PEZI|nr:uncharacterized protein D7B24_006225 [Verticillium nonalfalfae]RNJ57318.1 hypothetical protein D7B24_006225 [Verticillium nonalfalfae]
MKVDDMTAQLESMLAQREAAPQPEGTTGPAPAVRRTVDEVYADLQTSPLFMTELDEDNETVAALQALAFEGTPLENGTNFKDQGNECFRARRWADARAFYTQGIDVLLPGERARRRGATTRRTEREVTADGREVETEVDDAPADVAALRACLEALYVNRGACELALRNHRACWLDCGLALRLNPRNVKALYRSSRALLAVGRIDDADDACAHGLAVDPENEALRTVAGDIVAAAAQRDAKKKADDARADAARRRAADARVRLVPDEEDPRSSLVVPVVLLYPTDLESDFVKAFGEADVLADHLRYIFPLPWDRAADYTLDATECYVETVAGGLMKWGKKMPLLKVLASGSVEIVDDVFKVFVVPKAKAAAWVEDFKMKKAAEKKHLVVGK